jgi:hypothetical protein
MLKTVGNPSVRSGDQTILNGNLVIGTAGKGIDFSADPSAAGMTSELLDDYEEGTFTPVISGTTIVGTATYTAQLGKYTKVGRLVTCVIRLTWSSGTGTGSLSITGLPFSNAGDATYGGGAFGWFSDITLTANNVATAYMGNGNAIVSIFQYPTGGGTLSGVVYDAAGNMNLTISYMTA